MATINSLLLLLAHTVLVLQLVSASLKDHQVIPDIIDSAPEQVLEVSLEINL